MGPLGTPWGPAAASRPVVVAGPGKAGQASRHARQGKQAGRPGKAGPGQTKPRLGTTGKPAKPKQF